MALTRLVGLLLALLAGTACTTHELSPVETNPAGFAAWTGALPAYRYNAGDRIAVHYLLTPEMDEEVNIAPDGTVGLKAAGQVEIQGLTATEIEGKLAVAARKILRNPIVTVSLVEAKSAKVYVGGAVVRPGPYLMGGQLGVLEAVLLAGGFNSEGRVDEVIIIRRNPENRPMLRTVDVQNFLETADPTADVPVVAGDIIFVPRSKIAEVNLWIERFIDGVLPFERSFQYTINLQQTPNL